MKHTDDTKLTFKAKADRCESSTEIMDDVGHERKVL